MKITLVLTGKTEIDYILKGLKSILKESKGMSVLKWFRIPDIKNAKNLTIEQYKQKEAENQVKYLQNSDLIILLDEFGKEYTSVEFAKLY